MMTVNYVKDMLRNCGDGLDVDMRQLALDDAKALHGMGVSSDRERNLVFYLDHFLDDICSEMEHPTPKDRWKVIKAAFQNLKGKDDIDLVDIRRAVAFALGILKRRKVAYPNIAGVVELGIPRPRSLDKWVGVLRNILAAVQTGETREAATKRLTEGWDPVETLEFRQWAKYYHTGDHEKYASLSKRAVPMNTPPMNTPPMNTPMNTPMDTESVEEQQPTRRPSKHKTPDENKRALVSRIDSAKRLLRLFAPPVWPLETWNRLYQTCSDLEQEIIGLRTASTMRDRIIRTANIWELEGFSRGAEELRKIAQPPTGGSDVAKQIEKALTGKEYTTKSPTGGLGLGEDLGLGPEGGLPPLPPGGEAAMPGEPGTPPLEGAPEGAFEEMPSPPKPPEPEKKEKEREKEEEKSGPKDENPYADSSVKDVLGVLEPLTKELKERSQVRELSRVDMMMEGLNIASYFPELGEAMAKLIESNNYVSTRLEKIIGKLKGGETGGSPKEEPPPIEMGGKPEETALEVGSPAPREKPEKPEETVLEVGAAPPAGKETPPAGKEAPPVGVVAPTTPRG